MSERQRVWNSYEAVILLEGLLKIINDGASRKAIVGQISCDLREMARRQGEIIDEIFRNENGISFQLQSMESAYKGYTISQPATKLFLSVVEMYRQDRTKYDKLLGEARAMINKAQSCESDFMTWLSMKVSPAQLSELYWCYTEIESSCLRVNLLKKPLFETTDYETIQAVQKYMEQNKYFHATHRRQFSKLITAGRHYLTYTKEMDKKSSDSGRSVSEQPRKFNGAVTINELVDLDSFNRTKEKDISKKNEVVQNRAETSLVRTGEDERLLAKYPIIYKRVFFAVQSSIREKGLSIGEIQELTQRIGRASDIEEILNNASWSKRVDSGYSFSDEIIGHDDETQEESKDSVEETIEQNEWIIDFNNLGSFAHTKPCSFTYFKENKGVCSSWTDLYVSFFAVLYEDYPHIFRPGMSFSVNKGRIELARKYEAGLMVAPKDVPGTDYVIETNISATDIVRKMKYLLDFCSVDYENVVIKYCRRTPAKGTIGAEMVQPINSEQKAAKVDRHSFYQYLIKTQNLSVATSRSYSSAIGSCESFAREHHYESWRLYTSDLMEAKATVNALFRDEEFIEYNDRWHNQLRAAITKLLVFISDGAENIHNQWKPSYSAQIEKLISLYYKYGFRTGSPIELMRFRNYARNDNLNLPDSDEELEKEIASVGTVIDGKVFVLASSTLNYLQEQMAGIFASGCSVIFLEAFYDKNIDFMEENHIASVDMLKEFLKRCCPEYYYGQNIVTAGEKKTEVTAIMDDIYHLCGDDGIIICSDIIKQLEYIPEEKILWTLSYCDKMVRIEDGKYFNLNYFIVSDADASAIKEYVKDECNRKGYASISDVPMGSIPEENYELSKNALCAAIYTVLLKAEYGLNGKILTRGNAQMDVVFLLKSFCRNLTDCTVADVNERMKELTGTTNKQYSMIALFDTMVRIDGEHFVSEDQIDFDVDTIDNLLNEYVGKRFAPIRSIPTFAMFPICGANWNYYLLESYCYRFSKRYRLSVMNYNDKNAGLIVSKDLSLDYNDMLSEAAANADIELTDEAVGKFFFDYGYTAKRKYASMPDIIAKANIIRKES